jgi:hypothetical protein
MVAYHFPPMNVSSGIQRTLRFSRYLPEFGWEPTVLTVRPMAYPSVSAASLADIPAQLRVRRTLALDTSRHLALAGRYPRFLCVPDRWWSWWLSAVPAGLALIRKLKPDVLWTTYPVATAHLIGYTLNRLTGIPWVADFRDPMAQEGFPEDRLTHRAFELIEQRVMQNCRRAVFTAPGALKLYTERYPEIPASRFATIENGYDEEAFAEAEASSVKAGPDRAGLVLIHSGTIYPSERDPRAFFGALSQLAASGEAKTFGLRVVLRATGCDNYLRGLITEHAIGEIVALEPSVPYRAALAEMLNADALIILQEDNCNYQVPAKLYEYLRAGRPILALTDPKGDTAGVLLKAGVTTIAPLNSQKDIAALLARFLQALKNGEAPLPSSPAVKQASRQQRTAALATLLDLVAS